MAKSLSFGKIDVAIQATLESSRGEIEPDTPFRIALLGDFSNRASRGLTRSAAELARLRPILIDRDNFDDVMAGFGIEVQLPADTTAGAQSSLRFSSLEDFHPDRLYERVETFRLLRDLRKRLDDPKTFAVAVAELQTLSGPTSGAETEASTQASAAANPDLSDLSPGDLLSQIIGEPKSETKPSPSPLPQQGEWHTFLQRIVAPHLTPKTNPRRDELVAQVDAIISQQMRTLLHAPTFQAVEAAWRAVFFLVNRVETSPQLKLYLFDMSQEELAADLRSTENLQATALYRLLVEQSVGTLGGEPWAALAGHYTFSATETEVEVLGRLAKIAQQAGAPFVAAANSQIFGCGSLAKTPDPDDWQQPIAQPEREAWQTLRHLPEAIYLGLAVPRFLLRLPYGRDTEPLDHFAFEEMDVPPSHEAYLWGNPTIACAYLLAEAFSQDEWDLRPGVSQNIEGLPLHIYRDGGESITKPCAETWLTERAVERILDAGLMPLVSMKNQDVVRLARFQSLADPPCALAGRWNE
jgi:type VI secretion system protein ImpC